MSIGFFLEMDGFYTEMTAQKRLLFTDGNCLTHIPSKYFKLSDSGLVLQSSF